MGTERGQRGHLSATRTQPWLGVHPYFEMELLLFYLIQGKKVDTWQSGSESVSLPGKRASDPMSDIHST